MTNAILTCMPGTLLECRLATETVPQFHAGGAP
jgi:hypothetical protein